LSFSDFVAENFCHEITETPKNTKLYITANPESFSKLIYHTKHKN